MKPFFDIHVGAARVVWLVGPFALKFPRCYGRNLAYGRLDSLCKGISQNIREYRFFKTGNQFLCPIAFHIHGLCNVMRRAQVLTEEEFERFRCDDEVVNAITESKSDSWGIYAGRVVSIDYSG